MINNHLINKNQVIAIAMIIIFTKIKSADAKLCLQKRLKTDIVQLTNKERKEKADCDKVRPTLLPPSYRILGTIQHLSTWFLNCM